jgi:peptide deformylase
MIMEPIDFAKLPLIHFADKRLHVRPPEFLFDGVVDPIQLADGLFNRMKEIGGVGLAANQLGLPYRMFVFGNDTARYNVFNPLVIGVSKETVAMQEGCLSFPELFITIRRPKEVTASYTTETGEVSISTFSGLAARVFLHEYDHMEGLVFIQHASKFKADWELGKLRKRMERKLKTAKRTSP